MKTLALQLADDTARRGEAKVFVIEAGIDEREERMLELAAGNIGTEEVVGWPSDHVARRQGTV